jgi:hypothetical protein
MLGWRSSGETLDAWCKDRRYLGIINAIPLSVIPSLFLFTTTDILLWPYNYYPIIAIERLHHDENKSPSDSG